MFTGIIEAVSPILSIRDTQKRRLVRVQRPSLFDDLRPGSSVACDGICLTVLEHDSESFEVEVMAETLGKTTAGTWNRGTKLNLERALKLGGRLDGHWVQGHVDRVLSLSRIKQVSDTIYLYFSYPREDAPLMVPQGSVCLNGVSLTIAELEPERFAVALISHTLDNSNLAILKPGGKVNLEYDVLGKYLARKSDQTGLSE